MYQESGTYAEPLSATAAMNLVMFGSLAWTDTWYSRHHLVVGLARRHRVVLVEPPPDFGAVLRDPLRGIQGARLEKDALGFERYRPPGWLPQVYSVAFAGAALNRLRARRVRRALAQSGAKRFVAYAWHPDFADAVAPFDDVPLVYHCYDKYDRYTHAPIAETRAREQRLARKATLCVAASTKLGEYLSELGAQRVLVLHHGVDPKTFRPGLPEPAGLAHIPHPRIGVVARLNEVLDMDSLVRIAEQRPGWSLVFIGGAHFTDSSKRVRFEALLKLPNVHHVGPQPQREVPNWLCGLDVGLACYDQATWGPYNQPIKIYEYLGCGLPVVSSDITAAREFGPLVERCPGTEDWVPAIERALASTSPATVEQRAAFARMNSWERRVTELETALKTVFEEHTAP